MFEPSKNRDLSKEAWAWVIYPKWSLPQNDGFCHLLKKKGFAAKGWKGADFWGITPCGTAITLQCTGLLRRHVSMARRFEEYYKVVPLPRNYLCWCRTTILTSPIDL